MNVRHRTRICVIESGGAGLRAAIAAHKAWAEVLVVGKRTGAAKDVAVTGERTTLPFHQRSK